MQHSTPPLRGTDWSCFVLPLRSMLIVGCADNVDDAISAHFELEKMFLLEVSSWISNFTSVLTV